VGAGWGVVTCQELGFSIEIHRMSLFKKHSIVGEETMSKGLRSVMEAMQEETLSKSLQSAMKVWESILNKMGILKMTPISETILGAKVITGYSIGLTVGFTKVAVGITALWTGIAFYMKEGRLL
jgi:hypothetical protein